MKWKDIEAERAKLCISRAEMCRRAGISDSTVHKGVKADGTPTNPIFKQLRQVLDAERKSQST